MSERGIEKTLVVMEWVLWQILNREVMMSAQLDALAAQVAQNTQVEASAVTLIQGIAQKLADAIASNDPAKLTELQNELNTSATALAAAVSANTG